MHLSSTRPIRVHVLVDSLGVGGAEVLVSEFAAVAKDVGVDLSVAFLKDLHGSPSAVRLRRHGIEPQLIGIERIGPSAVLRVRRHMARLRPQLVHTHLGYSDLLGGLAARSLGIPTLSTVHGIEWGSGTVRGELKTRLMAVARRHCAERVLAVSDNARTRYLERGWDLPERVRTVRSGIAGTALPQSGARVRAGLGLNSDDLVVTMMSGLRAEKRHDLAVGAISLLRVAFPAVRLLVVGDGPARAEVAAHAASLGDTAILAGYRDDVMAVLDATDVLLQPSRIEAFPTAILEAMAASVPVVATAVGGIPEIVEPEVTGILVEPSPSPDGLARAVARLLRDPGLRARLGAAGRRRFEQHFTAIRWAERVRREYDSVLTDGLARRKRVPLSGGPLTKRATPGR